MATMPPSYDTPSGDRNRAIILVVGMLFLLGLVLWFYKPGLPIKPSEQKIIKIALPPPPPPPPPPPLDKPKPVEEPQKTVETPSPKQPSPDNKPKQEAPVLTSQGPPGQDAFGAKSGDGTVGDRIGGCTGPNCGTGGGLVRSFGDYQNVMAGVVKRQLNRERKVRGRYDVAVNVTVGTAGEIKTAQLTQSTGDAQRDALIQQLLIGLRPDRTPNTIPTTALIRVSVRLGG